jgi:hypothetical protein
MRLSTSSSRGARQGANALAGELGAPAGCLFAGDVVAGGSAALEQACEGAAALVIATSAVPVVTGPPGPDGRPTFGFKAGQMPEQADWQGQKAQIDVAFERGVQQARRALLERLAVDQAAEQTGCMGHANGAAQPLLERLKKGQQSMHTCVLLVPVSKRA